MKKLNDLLYRNVVYKFMATDRLYKQNISNVHNIFRSGEVICEGKFFDMFGNQSILKWINNSNYILINDEIVLNIDNE